MNQAIFTTENSILITFLSSFLIWFMVGGLVILWVIDGKVKREQAMHAFLSAVFAWAVSMMIKSIFPSERPFALYGFLPSTLTIPSVNSSFPSIHSAVAFAIATSVRSHSKTNGNRFLVLAAFVALGRILSGVHYILDVLVGAVIGTFSTYVIKRTHVFKLVK